MNSKAMLAIRTVAGASLLGTLYAVFTTGDLIVSLLSDRLTIEVLYPPIFHQLLAILVLLTLLMITLGVATWQSVRAASPQSTLAAGWSPGFVLLWILVWGWILLVYYPIPYRAHHIDRFSGGVASLLLWGLLYVLKPGWLAAFLRSRPYEWLRVAVVNLLLFVVIGEALLRLADPWLAQAGPFAGKHTPSFLTPHAKVEGSIGVSNSLGFRDRERTVARATAAPRVIAIGDSFTYGVGVSYDQVFVTLLERGLQEQVPGAEVLNMGVPGWGPHEELELLASTALRFKPDVVVVNVYVGNDIISGSDADAQSPMIVAGDRYLVHATGQWIHDHWGPQRWYLYHQINYLRTIGPIHFRKTFGLDAGKRAGPSSVEFCGLYGRETSKYFEYFWNHGRDALEAMVRLLRSQGIEVLLVLHPDPDQLYEWTMRPPCSRGADARQYDFERPQRYLREWTAMKGVPTVDLLPAFRGVSQPPELYLGHEYDNHYSAQGHRLAAMTILPSLRDRIAHVNDHTLRPGQSRK